MAEAYKKINELTEMLAVDINESTKMVVSTGVGEVSKNLNVSDLVVNNLSSSSEHRALSAAMGKKLSEEKAPLSNPQFTGSVGGVTKGMVGLGNVDNTSDIAKPISQAVQSALDSKAPINSPTFTGLPIFSGLGVQFNCPINVEGNVAVFGDLLGENEVGANTIFVGETMKFGPDAKIKIQTGTNGSTPIYREFPATELSSSDLNGAQYVMVYGVGTPEENAVELQTAYNEAKKMPRYFGTITEESIQTIYAGQTLHYTINNTYYRIIATKTGDYTKILGAGNSVEITESEAKSTRTTVIVAPGEYNFGASAFVVDSPGINIVSLTGNSDVIISSTEYAPVFEKYGIKVIADYILIKGINCKTKAFYIESYLDNLICEYCVGGNYSFGGNDGIASGTFNNCVGGVNSFGSGGALSGELINCKLTEGTFPTPTGAGKIYNSIDGNGNLINIPLPIFADNVAAASLAVGTMYRTATGVQMIKY